MPNGFVGTAEPLTANGLAEVGDKLGVRAPEIWAILTVETLGCGFLPDRRPEILFERHIFHGQTNGHFDNNPEVSSSTPGGYGAGGAHQYERLATAIALDRHAALCSTSWGIGQVMGFNATVAGFANVETMVNAMAQSEDQQLIAMSGFVASNHLADNLRTHDWTGFAKRYNGPDFAKNRYDQRLSSAFDRFTAGPLPDLMVRAAQVYLRFCGFNPGPIDGIMGQFTRNALQEFRARQRLAGDDSLDDAVLNALRAVASATG